MISRVRAGLAWAGLTILLLGLGLVLLVTNGTLESVRGRDGVLPRERLVIEDQMLDADGISLRVRAEGPLPVRIAQVQVDGAFWDFAQAPLGTLPPGTGGWLHIPYPWVYGEGHLIQIVTGSGAVFEHRIERAAPTPVPTPRPWLGLLGLVIGAVPLALVLAGGSFARWASLTLGGGLPAVMLIGLIVLLERTAQVAFECATETGLRVSAELAVALVLLVAATTATLLLLATRLARGDGGVQRRLRDLVRAMGLRNACAGLAIGAAFAVEAATLASWLAIAMALHNGLTGGRWLVHLGFPRLDLRRLSGLAATVGLPTALAIGFGAYAIDPGWAALALAIGAGALLRITAGLAWYLAQRAWPVAASEARDG